MRLKSMFPSIPIMVGSFLAFAWTSQEKVRRLALCCASPRKTPARLVADRAHCPSNSQTNIAGPLVCLFCSGFSMMTIYSSVLAYLVDANVGRSAVRLALFVSLASSSDRLADHQTYSPPPPERHSLQQSFQGRARVSHV